MNYKSITLSGKKIITLFLFTFLLIISGCKNNEEKKQELNLFNWKFYIGDSTIAKFEKEFNVKVNLSYYSSNEECLAKLKSNKGNYDIIIPSDYMVDLMINEGLVSEIDVSKIENFKNIDSIFLGEAKGFDPSDKYSVPYMYGTTGFARNQTNVKNSIRTWSEFFGNSSSFTVLDDVRFVFGSVLMELGYDPNTTNENELSEVVDLLLKNKKNLKAFTKDTPKEMLINGEANLSYAWSGDAIQASYENKDVKYELPKNGTLMFQDGICIPKEAPNRELALKFINFLLRPDVSAEITNTIKYGNTNKEAKKYIKPEILNNESVFPSVEYIIQCKRIKDVGNDLSIYEKYWNKLKAE